MNYKVVYDGTKDPITQREQFRKTIENLMDQNSQIVYGDADMGYTVFGTGVYELMEKFGDRYWDCGVQEANMLGMAAGMSITGKIPYLQAFCPFLTRRAYDTLFISLAYSKLNVRLCGSDPGYTSAYNGGTHMTLEDVGIMRSIPNMTIVDATDNVMLDFILKDSSDKHGLYYFRMGRGVKYEKVYADDSVFEWGKANLLREGTDITLLASGLMVAEALKAAEKLAHEGIRARVADVFTIKPLDEAFVLQCAAETGAIVTCENHRITNGLGSAVADVLTSSNIPCVLEKQGAPEEFGAVGPADYLAKRYCLTETDIYQKAKLALERKKEAVAFSIEKS